jgi:hypothetical protein
MFGDQPGDGVTAERGPAAGGKQRPVVIAFPASAFQTVRIVTVWRVNGV